MNSKSRDPRPPIASLPSAKQTKGHFWQTPKPPLSCLLSSSSAFPPHQAMLRVRHLCFPDSIYSGPVWGRHSPGVASALLGAGGHRRDSGPRPQPPDSSRFSTMLRQSPLNIITWLFCFSFLMLCICGGESYRPNSKYFVQSAWMCQDFLKWFPLFSFLFASTIWFKKRSSVERKKKSVF